MAKKKSKKAELWLVCGWGYWDRHYYVTPKEPDKLDFADGSYKGSFEEDYCYSGFERFFPHLKLKAGQFCRISVRQETDIYTFDD